MAVHATMIAAFEEYGRFPNPSSALRETPEDTLAAIARGAVAVIEEDGQLVASVRCVRRPGVDIELSRLAVIPPRRGRGHGATLVRFVEAYGRAGGCALARTAARSQQPDNRGWWTRLGYRIVGYEDVYGVPRLRTLLEKPLTPDAG